MNKRAYRLVFDRQRGMRVAAAETTRSAGKAAGGQSRATRQTPALFMAAAALATSALAPCDGLAQVRRGAVPTASSVGMGNRANLPQVYTPRGDQDARRWVDPAYNSRVSWAINGTTGTFDQGDVEKIIVNWNSFDIGRGYQVNVKQMADKDKAVSALFKIWSEDPSLILGTLKADREVILQNANGVLFGRGAVVDTGRFVATALSIADKTYLAGLRNVTDGQAVFTADGTDFQPTNLNAVVSTERGSTIRTAAGGDVLLIAPRVLNQGTIETKQGQAILAAGEKVYLSASGDSAQRGLIVAVDAFANQPDLGVVENAAGEYWLDQNGQEVAKPATAKAAEGLVQKIDQIKADTGSVNLVGLLVKQNGIVRATTAVKGLNGGIYLQGQQSTVLAEKAVLDKSDLTLASDVSKARVAQTLGTVVIGANSVTSVTPVDDASQTQVTKEQFNRSVIKVDGQDIQVQSGARVEAPSGTIQLRAAQQVWTTSNGVASKIFTPAFASEAKLKEGLLDDTRAFNTQDDGSRISIESGASLSVAGLRDVAVDGERYQGDMRLFRIELADAPLQRGGVLYRERTLFDIRRVAKANVANLSGALDGINRTAQELSTQGGTLMLDSQGALLIDEKASLDVSGGSIKVSQAKIKTSAVRSVNRVADITQATKDVVYDDLITPSEGRLVPEYTEGQDAGSLHLSGRRLSWGGQLQGSVVRGERQRAGQDATAKAAQLILGRRFATAEGQYHYTLDTLNLRAASGASAVPSSINLSLADLARAGFGRIDLMAAHIQQDEYSLVSLVTDPSNRLSMQAHDIRLDGAFVLHGGLFSAVTDDLMGGDLTLSGNTRIDTSGVFTNDRLPGDVTEVQTQGGHIQLKAAGDLTVAAQAVLDVSAGAWWPVGSGAALGKAGSITLASGVGMIRNAATPLSQALVRLDGAVLRGFDFSMGGTLSIDTARLTVANQLSAPGSLVLSPAFFSQGGFGSYQLSAMGDVLVKADVQLKPTLKNFALTNSSDARASGTMRDDVVKPVELNEAQVNRQPVNISLAATGSLLLGDAASTFKGSNLTIERGAQIVLEEGARLALSATGLLTVGAPQAPETASLKTLIQARGGVVDLSVKGTRGATAPESDQAGFFGNQALWIGSGTMIDVQGSAEVTNARPDLRRGRKAFQGLDQADSVLGGGQIKLSTSRGYVVVEKGATLNLDGHSASVYRPGMIDKVLVSKDAGTLSISTPEGFVLEGAVSAKASHGGNGGTLKIDIASSGNLDSATAAETPYPTGPRELRIGATGTELSSQNVMAGQDLSTALGNGIGYLSAATLAGGGFATLDLRARDQVSFLANTNLNATQAIHLHANALSLAADSTVNVSSNLVSLGRANDLTPNPVAAVAGTGVLNVQADAIEWQGQSTLLGTNATNLSAREIRLVGRSASSRPTGGLNFSGTLSMQADQVYATYGSLFTIQGDAESKVTLKRRGSTTPAAPLSAFAQLSIKAKDIDHDGVIRQPFGVIELDASRELRLGAHSLTSVSGKGLLLPGGTLTNQSTWQAQVVPADLLTALPVDKRITLKGAQIINDPQAVVNAQAGGDLQTREFFPGVGGSKDYLSTEGLYAILPDYAGLSSLSTGGTSAQTRQLVITSPGGALPPGRYTLLPADHALLAQGLPQGAFLVSVATDQGNKVPLKSAIKQADGSELITGAWTEAGANTQGLVTQRFMLESPTTFRAKSDIRTTTVSEYLNQRSQALGLPATTTPMDAGHIQLTQTGEAGGALVAQVKLNGDGQGRAGLLDVSATQLTLADQVPTSPGTQFYVSTATLGQSGAGSVLLGGLRQDSKTTDDQGHAVWTLDTTKGATQVTLSNASPLSVQELLVSARDTVSVSDGAAINAMGQTTLPGTTLSITGDGALLALSNNEQLDVQRTPDATPTDKGTLKMGANTKLQARALQLDATKVHQLDDTAKLSAERFGIAAARLSIGGATEQTQATVLSGQALAAARAAQSLTLRSYSSIDFVGSQDWGSSGHVFKQLTLDASSIGAWKNASVTLSAQDVTLRNTSGQAPEALTDRNGSLRIEARPPVRYGRTGGITKGTGQTRLNADQVTLFTNGDFTVGKGNTTGLHQLQAQKNLTIQSARITAQTGAEQSIKAAGALLMQTAEQARTLGEHVGHGAKLSLEADTITQQGTIDLASGILNITALNTDTTVNSVVLGADSSTSVAGFALQAQPDWRVYGDGGTLNLSTKGGVQMLGTVDVGAAQEGNGGTLTLRASSLTLGGNTKVKGQAGEGADDLGGRLKMDLDSTALAASLDKLAQLSTQGGFTRETDLRIRSGAQTLNENLRAQRLSVTADGGSLTINGLLDAQAPAGGVVQVNAKNDVQLGANAQIKADSVGSASSAVYQGGDILLSSSEGSIQLNPAMADNAIDAGQAGRIKLRTLRSKTGALSPSGQVPLAGRQLKAQEVVLEGVKVYNNADINAALINTINNESKAYLATANTVYNQLALSADDKAKIRLDAGVEVRSTGDLTLGADWNLATVRTNGLAGSLTLRANGNLKINNNLSDGFATTATNSALSTEPNAWSLRLISGADISSAQVTATRDLSTSTTAQGNTTVATGKVVRTGAASIEMASGQDINLNNALVYTAGRKRVLTGAAATHLGNAVMTQGGREVSLKARGNINGPSSLAGIPMMSWFVNTGKSSSEKPDEYAEGSGYLGWWSSIADFKQSVASFGGGNIDIQAGGSITNLAVSSPTQAYAKSLKIADGIEVNNGGDITITAGKDILGGTYLLGRGEGHIETGGDFKSSGTSSSPGANAHAFGLIDGQWSVSARGLLESYAAFNPTIANTGTTNVPRDYYFTYSADSGLALKSLTGDISLRSNYASLSNAAGVSRRFSDLAYQVAPTSLSVLALGGNLQFKDPDKELMLYPSALGRLQLYAAKDLQLGSIAMLDGSTGLTTAANVGRTLTSASELSIALGEQGSNRNTSALHANKADPVRVAAGRHLQGTAGTSTQVARLTLPKAAVITAGQDITDLNIRGQHHQASDETRIEAGGNFIQKTSGGETALVLNGPGLLSVSAGRQFDLGDSQGIATTGNLNNPTLPSVGASVNVRAGALGTVNLDTLVTGYLNPQANDRASQHQQALITFVQKALKLEAPGAYAEALAQFRQFPLEAQRSFAQQVLAQEFGATYLTASALPSRPAYEAGLKASFDRYQAVQLAGLTQLASDLQQARAIADPKARQQRIAQILEQVPVALDNEASSRNLLTQDASLANIDKYLGEVTAFSTRLGKLRFEQLDIGSAVSVRLADRQASLDGWSQAVAQSLDTSVAAMTALAKQPSRSPAEQQRLDDYQQALTTFEGPVFERYRQAVLLRETRSAGEAASHFAVNTWPMLPALYNEGYRAQELGGVGSFQGNPWWPDQAALLQFTGNLALTGSTIKTQRGGDITLLAPGGEINVGLKEGGQGDGVLALINGNIHAISRNDLQVNTERIFTLGLGDIVLWSSLGDLDSGRGSNSAVAAGQLVARRTLDGVVFETPPPTSGSGIGVLDGLRKADGTAWLIAPQGEILALDAFIRAPTLPPSPSPIKGADNLNPKAGGEGAAVVVAPALSITPPSAGADKKLMEDAASGTKARETQASSLLTVELVGLGDVAGAGASAGATTGAAASEPANANNATPEDEQKKKKPR